jgi:dTDP-4-amino-4,6-dideoxygalactose transaminase
MSTIRLSKSCVGEEEKLALARVIDAEFLGMGPEVQSFEEELRTYIGCDAKVICVNTGTAALHLAVLCLGIGTGDEVLVPSITYVASFQAVSATGARPIACDVTDNRVFIDLDDAEKRITEHTKAIMPVHYASDSQEMDKVYVFAKHHNLRVIEDAAHGFGCKRNNKMVGIEGDIICFSFDGIKNITSGEGGAVVTSDQELAQRIKDARLLGVEKDTEQRFKGKRSWMFDVKYQGFRYHMSNLMAAIGREQLKKIPLFAEHRKKCVNFYRKQLDSLDEICFLDLDYENIVPHIFVVKLKSGLRDKLMSYLRASGIECGLHYQPNHLLRSFKTDFSLPIAENLADQLLSLPLHAELKKPEQEKVIMEIRTFLSDVRSGA